jgi:hypothetical protein
MKNAGLEKRLMVKGEEVSKTSESGEIPVRLEIVVP